MRDILASTLFQYSTKFQTFKQTALDRIVERTIYSSSKTGLDARDIQDSFKKEIGYVLPVLIFEESIKRLTSTNRIKILRDFSDQYVLCDDVKTEMDSIQSGFDRLFQKVIDKLFNNVPGNKSLYHDPFWYAMSYVFSNIGKQSAKLIEGQIDKETYFKPVLEKCIQIVGSKFDIDNAIFEKRLVMFFEETREPIYNDFKWNIAQNYFIANSLGINPNSEIFSEEIFKGSTLYLDTNVLLSLISTNNRYYNNAKSFITAAIKIDLKFCISKITIEEYERWVTAEQGRIQFTKKQIPKEMKSKIGSCIYQDLVEQSSISENGQDVLLKDITSKYLDYRSVIQSLIPSEKLEYIDDDWFKEVENKDGYEETVELVKEKYKETGFRTKKGDNAAIHDAKMLLWLDKRQNETRTNYWFVTADTSLPLIKIGSSDRSNSILLDVILQWMFPLTRENGSEEFQHTFSEIIKNRLLPKDIIFEVNDFLIFEELHMECAELPSKDVEECILYLKKNAPNMNPNDPKDREKLANRIAVYFADPGRKYKTELTERLKENEELRNQLGDVYAILEDVKTSDKSKELQIEEIKSAHANEIESLKSSNKDQIDDLENKLSEVSTILKQIQISTFKNKVNSAFNSYKKIGKWALLICAFFIIFGIFEFLPAWEWNLPGQLIKFINALKTENEAKYNIAIGLNIFLLSTLIIALFVFGYKRLWDTDNKKKKVKEIEEEIKEDEQQNSSKI